ncbi:hypothetical protein QQS21_003727 [Conoideocrella luteorostrata]|uniref:Myb-like domain-containing protein n=1 Tax=Conoideocrella luteorostrata TaxID=1105319 RepID=A0AAJ0CSS7_9HYPO|nr:hypothetical protein QQS21_003727 [Conoideocrella luteorostrata]
MSRTQAVQVQSAYTPIKDAMQRHENGVTKNRKTPLTGSGRAWREDEEAYLLQTRLQKMPYKHIAAHLNKTELACRLHYHQLSHGSTRRKRTASCSSGSSDPSPSQQATASCSPVYRGDTRSLSPPVVSGSFLPKPPNGDMRLSRIMSVERSPRLPAILPKPESLHFPQQLSETVPRYPMVVTPEHRHETLPPVNIHQHDSPIYQTSGSPLRLDTSRLSPPSASVHTPAHVDLQRLRAVYETHKSSFWTVVANDYGMNASPVALEQAWRSGACCQYSESNPITPLASPDKDRRATYRMLAQDKTRISSILDDDAEPRLR